MKSRISLFLLLAISVSVVVLTGCRQAQNASAFFVVPEHKDLGVVPAGLVEVEFEIFNNLSETIHVQNIYPSCKCASVKLRDNPISPGESTILHVTADLKGVHAGKKDFTVMLTTDCPGFPYKRVSFTTWTSPTEVGSKRVSIGSFFANANLDVAVPVASITSGLVRLGDNKNSDVKLELSPHSEEPVLLVAGNAPGTMGEFSVKHLMFESFPDQPDIEEHEVELELVGKVIPRWDMNPEIYGGFLSIKDKRAFETTLKSNVLGIGRNVASVSASLDPDWIKMRNYTAGESEIVLEFELVEEQLESTGAVEAALQIVIKDNDGNSETYSSTVYAQIE